MPGGYAAKRRAEKRGEQRSAVRIDPDFVGPEAHVIWGVSFRYKSMNTKLGAKMNIHLAQENTTLQILKS